MKISHATSSAHSFVLGLDGFEQSMKLSGSIIAQNEGKKQLIREKFPSGIDETFHLVYIDA